MRCRPAITVQMDKPITERGRLGLYAPAEAFWNKTFKLPDVELVK